MPANINNYVKLAKILSPHGIKGECKLYISPEFIDLFTKKGIKCRIEGFGDYVVKVRAKDKKFSIARIEEIDDRNKIEEMKGSFLEVLDIDLPELEDDEFYHSKLEGLMIYVDGKEYGQIKRIVNFGAGDVVEILVKNEETIFLPFTKDIFTKIDDNKVEVKLPDYI